MSYPTRSERLKQQLVAALGAAEETPRDRERLAADVVLEVERCGDRGDPGSMRFVPVHVEEEPVVQCGPPAVHVARTGHRGGRAVESGNDCGFSPETKRV